MKAAGLAAAPGARARGARRLGLLRVPSLLRMLLVATTLASATPASAQPDDPRAGDRDAGVPDVGDVGDVGDAGVPDASVASDASVAGDTNDGGLAEALFDAGVTNGGLVDAGAADAGAGGAGALPDGGAPILLDDPHDAEAPVVRAAAERGEASLGEPFTLFVFSEAGPGVEVNLREPMDLGPAFEVRRKESKVTERADGGKLVEWQLEVFAWEVGDLRIPPIAVTFTVRGRVGQVHTAPAPIRVRGTLAEDDDGRRLRGMAPPIGLLASTPLWPWLVGGGSLVVLLAGLWWWRRSRHRVLLPAVSGAPLRPRLLGRPGQRALDRLDALAASGLLLTEQRTGYVELSEIFRELVAAHAGIATRDLTSAELERAVTAHAATAHAAAAAAAWMSGVDRVKYAAYVADAAEVEAVLEATRALVIKLVEPQPQRAAVASAVVEPGALPALSADPDSAPAPSIWAPPDRAPALVVDDEAVDATAAAESPDAAAADDEEPRRR